MKFKAIVFEGRINPLVLKSVTIPDYVNDNFVCVDLKAAALNRRDYWITQGLYPDIAESIPTVLGADGCGVYKGEKVIICPNVNWGKRDFPANGYSILGLQEYGTFAEKVFVREEQIYAKPSHLSFEEAACLPLAGLTAFRALFSRSKLTKGQKILISGIGGGVALIACQFAIAVGAEVYVTSSSEEKINKAIKLGAIDGVSYKDKEAMDSLANRVNGFDVIIDSAGGKGFNQLLKMCKIGANVSIYGGTRGSISGVATPNLFFKQISIHGSTMGSDLEFKRMLDFVNEHKIVPVIDDVRTLEDGISAIEDLGKSQHFGKIVLKV